MSPLVDIRYTNSNLDLSSGAPQVFIGGQNGYPTRPDVCQPRQLRTALRHCPEHSQVSDWWLT